MKSTPISAAGAAFRPMVAAILLALIAANGSGCGQRGPLYLPDAEPDPGGPAAAADAEARPDPSKTGSTDESTDNEDNE